METVTLTDGTKAFRIRVRGGEAGQRPRVTLHEREGCSCCDGGGWDERAARIRMGDILAEIRVGVWEPPARRDLGVSDQEPEGAPETYSALAAWVVEGKVSGELGERGPIAENSQKDLEWRLGYSKEYFGETPVVDLDLKRSMGLKRWLFKKRTADLKAAEAGAVLRDRRGRRRKPLALSSIKKIIAAYAAVLQEAVEEGIREGNPGRSRRMKVKVPKPKRTYLELDELGVLLAAAGDQEVRLPAVAAHEAGGTSGKVARLAASGRRPTDIAAELSIAKSTVTYHLRNLGVDVGRGYVGRRVVCELLGRGGLRASEVCDLRIEDAWLHEAGGARIRIVDAKSEAGERILQLTPESTEVLVDHIDRLRRAGLPTGATDYLVPNTRGRRMSRQRVGRIVGDAAALSIERLKERGLPPLQNTTPHTLRRTYISIALLVSKFDLKWVMDQVGHADSTMTMDVYNQLQKRYPRTHGEEFDRAVREANRSLPAPRPAPVPTSWLTEEPLVLAAA